MKRARYDASLESVVDVHQTHNHNNDLVTCNCSPSEGVTLTQDTRLTCHEVRAAKNCVLKAVHVCNIK